MSESINVENKKQNHQKPPRSLIGIACEILAGTAAGLAVALSVACLTGIVLVDKEVCFAEIGSLIIFAAVFPPLYGLACAVGVYLLGTRGKHTGSFLLTLVGGLLGGLVMLVILPLALFLSGALIVGVENIVVCAIGVLILLSPPIFATLGFNSRRRYKEQHSL